MKVKVGPALINERRNPHPDQFGTFGRMRPVTETELEDDHEPSDSLRPALTRQREFDR
jgi:uncharacterized protein (DUF2249 family)